MKTLMLTAMHSGAGKTVLTCALLAALKKRKIPVHAFKCGPDYIDPMFHSRVLGLPSRNLDLFLQGEGGVLRTLSHAGGGLALLEGAMGYFDGLNGTDRASAWATARLARSPAVLILRPKGSGLSLAAQVRGMMSFREPSGIAALLLNDCTPRLAAYLRPILERETGLPVLGYLPPMAEAQIDSRHLGLLTPEEVEGLNVKMELLAEALEQNADLDALLALAGDGPEPVETPPAAPRCCAIAVARDPAFCFCYQDSLDALAREGAELRFFSPLFDRELPAADGLYFCGGYSELYARALSENENMRRSVQEAVQGGLPTVAECGGFLYLQESLETREGERFPLCGVLPGRSYPTGGLRRFGYQWLESEADSLLFHRGERVPAHEFHHWDSTAPGEALWSRKPDGRAWRSCCATKTLYAGFPHLHLDGELPLARRFVCACKGETP